MDDTFSIKGFEPPLSLMNINGTLSLSLMHKKDKDAFLTQSQKKKKKINERITIYEIN